MSRTELSRTQLFFTRLVGAETAAAMEAHSRAWLVRCPNCGHERSIWDLGGIRYKAVGNQRTLMRCEQCGKRGWHSVYRAADFPNTTAPAWPIVRLILLTSVAALILVGLMVGIMLYLTGVV
jgi:ribosomal protein S27E